MRLIFIYIIIFLFSCQTESDSILDLSGMSVNSYSKSQICNTLYKSEYLDNIQETILEIVNSIQKIEELSEVQIYSCYEVYIAEASNNRILFNPIYVDSLLALPSTNRSLLLKSLIAHEISHIIYHKNLKLKSNSKKDCSLISKRELEADFFTGVLLHKLDVNPNIENSTYSLNLMSNKLMNGSCYPSLSDRIRHAQLGYFKGMQNNLSPSDINTFTKLRKQTLILKIPLIGRMIPNSWSHEMITAFLELYNSDYIEDVPDHVTREVAEYLEKEDNAWYEELKTNLANKQLLLEDELGNTAIKDLELNLINNYMKNKKLLGIIQN